MARGSAQGSVGQWPHPFAVGCLGEADRVAVGDDDVGVMQESVDGGVGDRLGHQFVGPGWVHLVLRLVRGAGASTGGRHSSVGGEAFPSRSIVLCAEEVLMSGTRRKPDRWSRSSRGSA